MQPRVLVISNESFSLSSSNGRTLGLYFKNWDKKKLAQFHIHSNPPDPIICKTHFCVTDEMVIKKIFPFLKGRENIKKPSKFTSNRKRSALRLILRNFFWNLNFWSKNFLTWVDQFSPEIIVFQNGDAQFLANLALTLAKKRDIPLIIYNSEDYYFKKYDYLSKKMTCSLMYRFFIFQYRKQFRKLIDFASFSFYANDFLYKLYNQEFNREGGVLYTSSFLEFKEINLELPLRTFSYIGNLGLNRHLALIEIGEKLNLIDKNIRLDVYGRAPSDAIGDRLKKSKGIRYHGLVDYSKVEELIYKSDVLVHAEYNSDFNKYDIRCGFTTKIADILSSGKTFFYYAPKELAGTQYLEANAAAFVCTSSDKLELILRDVIFDLNQRRTYHTRASVLAAKNHSLVRNTQYVELIIKKHLRKQC